MKHKLKYKIGDIITKKNNTNNIYPNRMIIINICNIFYYILDDYFIKGNYFTAGCEPFEKLTELDIVYTRKLKLENLNEI